MGISHDAQAILLGLTEGNSLQLGPYVPFLILDARATKALSELSEAGLVASKPGEKPRVHVWRATEAGQVERKRIIASGERVRCLTSKSSDCHLKIVDMYEGSENG